jgi:diguanylate cyclase (GGDEF)-like protein
VTSTSPGDSSPPLNAEAGGAARRARVQDPARLAALAATGLLDSAPEEAFDRLARLAAELLGAPVALVSLVDDHRQFFKSAIGLPEPWATRRETPLTHSFCKHAVASGQPLAVDDARVHPVVKDNDAIRDLGVVAYLGIPLVTAKDEALGVLCVVDVRPRAWTPQDLRILRELAVSVMREVELRDALRVLKESEAKRGEDHRLLQCVLESIGDPLVATDLDGRVIVANAQARNHPAMGGLDPAVALPRAQFFLADGVTPCPPAALPLARACRGERVEQMVSLVRTPGRAEPSWFSTTALPLCDATGAIIGAVSVFRDVTEVKNVELELRRERLVFHSTLENMGDAVIAVDPKGTLLVFNRAARALIGDPGRGPGTPEWDQAVQLRRADGRTPLPPEDLPIVRALAGTTTDQMLLVARTKHDPRPRDISVTARPLRDDTGAIVGGVSVIRDVSAQRAKDRELRDQLRVIELLQATTVAANEAQTPAEALERCLREMCRYLGWPVGHAYLREGGELVPSSSWYVDGSRGDFSAFREATAATRFVDGAGWLGRVAAQRTAGWLASIEEEPEYLRAAAARASKLRSGFMVPVLVGARAVAVLELYSLATTICDDRILSLMSTIGTQLGRVVERAHAHEQLQDHARSVREIAMHDELTGLYNRRGFLEVSRQHLKLSQRTGRHAAMLFVDLNGMKEINDELGHDEGDRALSDTGRILVGATRASDLLARLGGDEFAVLALEVEPTLAGRVAERIQAEVAAFNARGERRYRLSLSIGVAAFEPQAPRTVEALLTDADALMYQQKRASRTARARAKREGTSSRRA